MSAPRLLVLTQTVDQGDPVLGFFHGWLSALAKRFPHIHTICLKEGRHDLPDNVVVHSLGKERGAGRLRYVWNFYRLAWSLRREYDAVFVHMNPEYVVLGGLLWRLMGKRVYLWRNHWAGGLTTRIAVVLSHKTFCTSKASYTAKYKKNVLMPVGIDTDVFKPVATPTSNSILSLGRVSPSKNIHVILAALKILKDRGVQFTCSVYGDALPKDAAYYAAQKLFVSENGLSEYVIFYPGVKNSDTPSIYSSHQVFVNASASGMFDKTIFEAIACGALSIASSADYADFAGEKYVFVSDDADSLASKLEVFLRAPADARVGESAVMRQKVDEAHGLRALANRLTLELSTN